MACATSQRGHLFRQRVGRRCRALRDQRLPVALQRRDEGLAIATKQSQGQGETEAQSCGRGRRVQDAAHTFCRLDTCRSVIGTLGACSRPISSAKDHSRLCLLPWNTTRRSVSVRRPRSAARRPSGSVTAPPAPLVALTRVCRYENGGSAGRGRGGGPAASTSVTAGRVRWTRSPRFGASGEPAAGSTPSKVLAAASI